MGCTPVGHQSAGDDDGNGRGEGGRGVSKDSLLPTGYYGRAAKLAKTRKMSGSLVLLPMSWIFISLANLSIVLKQF